MVYAVLKELNFKDMSSNIKKSNYVMLEGSYMDNVIRNSSN